LVDVDLLTGEIGLLGLTSFTMNMGVAGCGGRVTALSRVDLSTGEVRSEG